MGASLGLHRLMLFYPERAAAQLAARKKALASRIGDGCMLGAALLAWHVFGRLDFAGIAALAPAMEQGWATHALAALLVLAALVKSAQFPLHGWLTEVMETPTPVSALLHAGIINAGGILLLRMSGVLALSGPAMDFLLLVGAVTAVFGAAVMLTQPSVKVNLAWSTIAQMGFMMMQCGLGAFGAALLHIVAHALYKAHAFLSSGGVVATRRPDPLEPLPLPRLLGRWRPRSPCAAHRLGLRAWAGRSQSRRRAAGRGADDGAGADAGGLPRPLDDAARRGPRRGGLHRLVRPARRCLGSARPGGPAGARLAGAADLDPGAGRLRGAAGAECPPPQRRAGAAPAGAAPSPAPGPLRQRPAEPPARPEGSPLMDRITRACARVAPLWPLRDFVAVNPFLGLADQPFAEAAATLRRVAGLGLLPGTAGAAATITFSESLDAAAGTGWTGFLVDEVSRHCAAWADEGQASWPMPWRDLSLHAAWRAAMRHDRAAEVAGLRGFRAAIAALPEDTEASIAASLEALAVPEARVDDYLHRALLQLGGWAGLLRARDFLGDALAPVRELLAIRLAWDAALHALHPAHRPAWQAGWAMPPPPRRTSPPPWPGWTTPRPPIATGWPRASPARPPPGRRPRCRPSSASTCARSATGGRWKPARRASPRWASPASSASRSSMCASAMRGALRSIRSCSPPPR
jgi:hypothetical protein